MEHSPLTPLTPNLSEQPVAADMDARDVKQVLVVTDAPRPAKAWTTYLNQLLRESAHALLACRLVVLAEGAIVEPGTCDEHHPAIAELTTVAKMNNVIIAAGSMIEHEPGDPTASWHTCPLIGRDGLIGSCRKQGMESKTERKIGVFTTPIGRIGILICLDIEDDALLSETAQNCDIVVNPSHIPHCGHGQRLHALQPIHRRLQWWSLACGVSIVRCDHRPPMGMATSMVITPCETWLKKAYESLRHPRRMPKGC